MHPASEKIDATSATPEQRDSFPDRAKLIRREDFVKEPQSKNEKAGNLDWVQPIASTWDGFIAELERRRDHGFPSVPTGIRSLDSQIGGGIPREGMTLVPSPPGAGKTSFAESICLREARRGRPAVFLSLELSITDAQSRLVCLEWNRPWDGVRKGKFVDDARNTCVDQRTSLFLWDGEMCPNLDALESGVQKITEQYGEAPLVCIDYAQELINIGSKLDVRLEADQVSTRLRDWARREKIPLVVLSSVSRAAYNIINSKGLPDMGKAMGCAKESGKFESDSNLVLVLARALDKEGKPTNRGFIIFPKNRTGGTPGYVAVEYDGLSGWYSEAADMAPMAKEKDHRPKIIKALAAAKKQSLKLTAQREIFERAGKGSWNDFNDALADLLNAGIVVKLPVDATRSSAKKYYTLSEKAESLQEEKDCDVNY